MLYAIWQDTEQTIIDKRSRDLMSDEMIDIPVIHRCCPNTEPGSSICFTVGHGPSSIIIRGDERDAAFPHVFDAKPSGTSHCLPYRTPQEHPVARIIVPFADRDGRVSAAFWTISRSFFHDILLYDIFRAYKYIVTVVMIYPADSRS